MNGKDLNVNDFPDIYNELGINVNNLGVVMLDTRKFYVVDDYAGRFADDLYFATNKQRFWIKGAVAESSAHITLLYGLLRPGLAYKPYIDQVLNGWEWPELEITGVGIFSSPYDDEPYDCVVAHIKVTDQLLAGRARLELLPHINTFVEYRPHMTLAYVKRGLGQKWVDSLQSKFIGYRIPVRAINYGGPHNG